MQHGDEHPIKGEDWVASRVLRAMRAIFEGWQGMPRLTPGKPDSPTDVDPIEVIRSALVESGSLARFMEVHYLASEPDLFAIMQVIAGLNSADRSALARFLTGAIHEGVRMGKVTLNTVELIRNPEEKS